MGVGELMRIAVLTTSFPRSDSDDAGIFVARLISALEMLGIGGLVVVPRDSDESYSPLKNFKVERFNYSLVGRRSLAFGAGIVPNIRRNPAVMLQIPGLLAGFFFALLSNRRDLNLIFCNWLVTSIPAVLFSSVIRVPVVVAVRGEDVRLLRSTVVRIALRVILRRVQRIAVVSSSVESELVNLLPELQKKIVTIENGVEIPFVTDADRAMARQKFEMTVSDRVLLFVGSVVPRKRVRELIEVSKSALEKGYTLIIVGRLDDHQYVEQCRRASINLKIESQVKFLGAVAPREVWTLLSIATLYVSASEFEGRPNALLEALASGVPAFVSDIPAHRTLITDSENGRLFRLDDRAQFQLVEMLEEDESLTLMGRTAKDQLEGKDWKGAATRYKELFREALSPSS